MIFFFYYYLIVLKKVQTGISATNMSQIIKFSDLKLAKMKSSKHRMAIVMRWDLLVSQETVSNFINLILNTIFKT